MKINNDLNNLKIFAIGNPGPQREELLILIKIGKKTATSYPLKKADNPDDIKTQLGQLQILVDSSNKHVGFVRITDVVIKQLGAIDDSDVQEEGEGFKDVADWRKAHEKHWLEDKFILNKNDWQMPDDTNIVIERFNFENLNT